MAMTPHSATLVLPPLLALIEKEAPGIQLTVMPRSSVRAAAMLDENEVDFILGVAHTLPSRFSRLELYEDEFVCVMRDDHELTAGPMTLDRFAAARHCVITAAGERRILFDELLKDAGYQIDNIIVLNEYLAGALAITNTQLVAGLLSRIFAILNKLSGSRLVARRLPLPKVDVSLTWHPGLSNHPAHDWMRARILEVSRRLPALNTVPAIVPSSGPPAFDPKTAN
jgi:DNA-binding transcriptional LysR family regulator